MNDIILKAVDAVNALDQRLGQLLIDHAEADESKINDLLSEQADKDQAVLGGLAAPEEAKKSLGEVIVNRGFATKEVVNALLLAQGCARCAKYFLFSKRPVAGVRGYKYSSPELQSVNETRLSLIKKFEEGTLADSFLTPEELESFWQRFENDISNALGAVSEALPISNLAQFLDDIKAGILDRIDILSKVEDHNILMRAMAEDSSQAKLSSLVRSQP